ncbi:MAG: 16S rRNA (cytosine(967)-C(5))-methyltransferase RsmB [Acidaminococcus sp.]|jgi:16S rRNA (cytosine967-C5)-methyltransferase|nr:16S rRNA (cytosine(967)-C(5))-methyltransferase RsmB [Acidaminococcus sp.]MCI2100472.1 16S rRNA (cytosine(967)-C(5))-methyltransferase RsmB [Acidaminococcus sp.]MCI2114793.1 16S rRNA (cytosine(967)-C(5))-methyltransferase RsmB [Acidaminococcus sp.]MCI2116846.1 16S rRNA (cytosine(967)-C(5))-methyltransferase RsmB [Acidaminococcus sp.]
MNKSTNPRAAALFILHDIYHKGAYANLALNKGLKQASLSNVDRRLATELVYGTVRTTGTLDWYLGKVVKRPLWKMLPLLRTLLRLGAYQILYLDRIPDAAAVNESAELCRHFVNENSVSLVNGSLRQLSRVKGELHFPEGEEHLLERIALEEFHPEWLVRRWKYRFGLDEAIALCRYDNTVPPLSLRVNTLKTTREALREKLQEAGIGTELSKWSPDGLLCHKLPSLEQLMKDFGTCLYIQDESSMLDAAALAPKPGETVLDLCSAPGGKATHLAQKMQNQGKLVAMDIYDHKLELVRANAERLGITCLSTRKADGTVFLPEWENQADKVLVDAPCSGLGVLNRRVEARWTKVEKHLSQFPPLQKKILDNAARYVKSGGRLLYSTCTLEQDENTRVRAAFLKAHPEFKSASFPHPVTGAPLEELQILPWRDGIDGFYLCLFEKQKED